jgi:hypothetical protein
MADNEDRLREAIVQIAAVANAAVQHEIDAGQDRDESTSDDQAVCVPKRIPRRLLMEASETARRINPVNAPMMDMAGGAAAGIMDPMKIAVLTTKYWGAASRRLTVSFMESASRELRRKIISHMNAWQCGISFVETTGTGTVRISTRPGGYWSYLGTDVLHIPRNRQTMNLAGFTSRTSEAEFRRVVRHETGHTLGFPHEHMRRELVERIDRAKAYRYYRRTQGWSEEDVDRQVLTPLDERSIYATPPDQTSIMCYQVPGSITRDGRPILGGIDINDWDEGFANRIYPLHRTEAALGGEAEISERAAATAGVSDDRVDDWDESEDVVDVDYDAGLS